MKKLARGVAIGIAALIVLIVIIAVQAMGEINPDPGWRAREAEIRRLEQEAHLRELRKEAGDGAS